ncbi:peroxidase 3 [Quercus suber]|uniref:peroxidase n=1 Tax=Quercus suber TaxID=58331 RepID=A0AAW0IN43_QUESU
MEVCQKDSKVGSGGYEFNNRDILIPTGPPFLLFLSIFVVIKGIDFASSPMFFNSIRAFYDPTCLYKFCNFNAFNSISSASKRLFRVLGGPFWRVPTGRRDGTISNGSEAFSNIPPPTGNLSTLQRLFFDHGLNLTDLVLLSGAHTIGVSHCSSFSYRLYNFTGVGDQDPALDPEYAANIKAKKCTNPNDNTTKVGMDPGSRKTFDLSYYSLLLKRRGLFQSDAALTTNSTTKTLVTQLLQGPIQNFYDEFAKSMEKMGRINVKTGSTGEIRKQCAVVNS